MTTTTQREIRFPQNGRVPKVDSPAVHAPARARIAVTKRDAKAGDRKSRTFTPWWGFTARPLSLRALWRLSDVDPKRIPADNTVLRTMWSVSNWTDRLLIFALIALTPTALTGPLRWCATRPTRRYGLYLTLVALIGAVLIGRKS